MEARLIIKGPRGPTRNFRVSRFAFNFGQFRVRGRFRADAKFSRSRFAFNVRPFRVPRSYPRRRNTKFSWFVFRVQFSAVSCLEAVYPAAEHEILVFRLPCSIFRIRGTRTFCVLLPSAKFISCSEVSYFRPSRYVGRDAKFSCSCFAPFLRPRRASRATQEFAP